MDPYFNPTYPSSTGINPSTFAPFLANGSLPLALPGQPAAGPSTARPPPRPPHPSAPQMSFTASSTLTTQSPGSSHSQESPTQTGHAHVITPYVEPHQDLQSFLESFWGRHVQETEDREEDFKGFGLPLARIKKVMKSDEEVKMISAEVMFSKACESMPLLHHEGLELIAVFISELTCRAWLVAESHKRRTLQKSDVAEAIGLSDMFDFLIDIVPREEEGETQEKGNGQAGGAGEVNGGEADLEEEEEDGGDG